MSRQALQQRRRHRQGDPVDGVEDDAGAARRAVAPGELLIVDDDEVFGGVLARGLARHGFTPAVATNCDDGLAQAQARLPGHAVVDLKVADQSGLDLIEPLLAIREDMHILVLTGFASIATAVNAIKLGAANYLAKPVDLARVLEALSTTGCLPPPPAQALTRPSPRRLEWEYIQEVLAQHGGNVSATARALNMHRRTLQRKLAKRPVQE
jgi:two-component system response regulator RegA